MHFTAASLLVAGLAAQQVTATSWPVKASKFSTCADADTTCSTEQHKGYNWSGLSTGSSVTKYGKNTFSGFTCSNSGSEKRDELTKRTFQSKCISGKLPTSDSSSGSVKGSSSGSSSGSLSIGCDSSADKFSISEMQVSSSYDTDIDCHYTMPDNTVCKQTASCSAGGSIIKNTQCGGAVSVSFSHSGSSSSSDSGSSSHSSGSSGSSSSSNKGDCTLNIHSVGFACGSSTSSSSTPSATVSLGTSSSVTSDVINFSTSSSVTSDVIESSTSSLPYSSPATTTSSVTSDVINFSTSSSVVVSSPSGGFSVYENSTSSSVVSPVDTTSSSVVVVVPTSSVPLGTGSYPSVSVSVSVSASVSASVGTGSSASFPLANSTGVYTGSSSATSSSTTSVPSANCPNVVPSCLNTYLHNTDCKDNTDSSCYCKLSEYISDVYQCIDAYGGDADNVSAAISYLVGICASDIPGNGAVITAIPSTITLAPSASTSVVNAETGSAVVSTGSTVYVTDVVSSTVTTCPVGHTLTQSGSTTVLTTPSVISTAFTTQSTVTAPVFSTATGAAATSSSAYETSPAETSPVSSQVAVPQTVTFFSTQIATVTSCAADVTNCPARSTVLSTTLIPTGTAVVSSSVPASSAVETSPASSSSSPVAAVTSSVSSSATVPAETVTSSVASSSPVGAEATSSVSSHVAVPSTVTLYSTAEITITSCGSEVTNCPARSTVVSTSLIPTGYTITSSVPAASSPVVPASGASSSSPVAAVSTGPVTSAVPSTITIYSSSVVTVTSCAAGVTNCPAKSTVVSTSTFAVGTTVTSVPAVSVPATAGSSEAAPTAGSSEAGPTATSSAVTSSTEVPYTTITYSSVVTQTATYTAGPSQGSAIPSSKITSTIHSTITVPQVQFITETVNGKPTVGLTYPSAVAATTTPATAASTNVVAPYGTGVSSGFAASTLASTYHTPTASPINYSGAGSKVGGSMGVLALGAVAAIFVL